ncbi:hypothetical protein [Bacteroides sp. 214]|uniref:hypothetical protein n=1 Tax=Bacteroides sp. 214 TaxID=2302935 RepID=UPI0013D88798|nr:hypothetical protein [Bacteroides sp. 214]
MKKRKMLLLHPLLAFLLVILCISCKGGQHELYFINKSEDVIYVGFNFTKEFAEADIIYDRRGGQTKIEKGDTCIYTAWPSTWESRFKRGPYMHFHVFPRNTYDYDSDEEASANKLMHYQFTQEDLEKMNWTIVYKP